MLHHHAISEQQLRQGIVEGQGEGIGKGKDTVYSASGCKFDQGFLSGGGFDVNGKDGLGMFAVVFTDSQCLHDLIFGLYDGLASLEGDQSRYFIFLSFYLGDQLSDHAHFVLATSDGMQPEGKCCPFEQSFQPLLGEKGDLFLDFT